MKTLWLIRHGESAANAGAATQDHETIPLTELGLEQAKRISEAVREDPSLIVVSPYVRAMQTAELTVKRFPNAKFEVWDDLREFTYLASATCIGTTAAERRERVEEYWRRLDPDYIDGEGAESFRQFSGRVVDVFHQLGNFKYRNDFIMVFSHAQTIRLLTFFRSTLQWKTEEVMQQFLNLPRVENAEIIRWTASAQKAELWNHFNSRSLTFCATERCPRRLECQRFLMCLYMLEIGFLGRTCTLYEPDGCDKFIPLPEDVKWE